MKVKIKTYDKKILQVDMNCTSCTIRSLVDCLRKRYGYKKDHIHLSCNTHSIDENSLIV